MAGMLGCPSPGKKKREKKEVRVRIRSITKRGGKGRKGGIFSVMQGKPEQLLKEEEKRRRDLP